MQQDTLLEMLLSLVVCTKIYSKNLTGLEVGSYINFEEAAHSVDNYKDGAGKVIEMDKDGGSFCIEGVETPDMNKKVKWGLAKDDVTPQDIFRMTNEEPDERAVIAKYCIQDCNLVHYLMNKIDVITGFIEMASLAIPLDFLVMRGQGTINFISCKKVQGKENSYACA